MKQLFSRLSSLVLIIVLVVLIFQRFPTIYKNFQSENQKIPNLTLTNLKQQTLSFKGNKTILVFWATWCPPCKIELTRINELITEKKIPAQSVVAVSMGESPQTVEAFLQKNPYLFNVVLDEKNQLAETFQVNVTPTLLFIDEDLNVDWRTTGVSPLLSIKIASFLNN